MWNVKAYLSIYILAFAKNELSFLSQSDQIKLSGFFSHHALTIAPKPCREPKLNEKSLSGKIANVVNPGKKCETFNSFDSLGFRIMNINSFFKNKDV